MAVGITTGTTGGGDGATQYVIEILTGKNAKKQLVLSDRCLPYRGDGYATPVTMRAKRTYYPGNPIATAQMLGAQYDDTTINGIWKDRFIRNNAVFDGKPLQSVADLIKLMETLSASGNLLEARWNTTVRRGYIATFTPKWIYGTDCAWEIKFEWTSDGTVASAPVISPPPIADGLIAAASQIDAVQQTTAAGLTDNPSSWLDAPIALFETVADSTQTVRNGVNRQLSVVRDTVSFAIKASQTIAGVAVLPAEIGNALSATVSTAISDLNFAAADIAYRSQLAYKRLADNLNAVYLIAATGDADSDATATYASTIQSQSFATAGWMSARRQSVLAARRTLIGTLADFRGTPGADVLAIYTARQGDDLRRVSTKFYGSPGGWRQIAKANRLKTPILAVGQVVVINNFNTNR